MTRHTGNLAVSIAITVTAIAAADCRPAPPASGTAVDATARRGGELVVNVRAEPQSFTWYTRHDGTTQLLTLLTQAKLVRVNRATEELEPWLAERWSRSSDGLTYTLQLRPDLTFADGAPFTADDVVFSFRAAYAPGSALADSLQVKGAKLSVKAVDPGSVEIVFPAPFGPGLRLLDNLPILPRHKLQDTLDAGTFADAWGIATPVSEITGLGPFVLNTYVPGQHLILTRNNRYFRKDEAGTPCRT